MTCGTYPGRGDVNDLKRMGFSSLTLSMENIGARIRTIFWSELLNDVEDDAVDSSVPSFRGTKYMAVSFLFCYLADILFLLAGAILLVSLFRLDLQILYFTICEYIRQTTKQIRLRQ